MSLNAILNFAHFSALRGAADDDAVDRLSHLYTVVVLCIFLCVVSGGQYVGNPIECLMPANFPGTHIAYTRSYCWVKNTYYIPLDQTIPAESVRRESQELSYYQWTPVILMFMALLFKFPCFFWRLFNTASAINLDKIVSTTAAIDTGSPEKRKETVHHIAQYIDRWLEAHRKYHANAFLLRFRRRLSKLFCLFTKREGTYLTRLYVFVKLLYVVNAVSQFFLLNSFMGGWYGLYGLEILHSLATDSEWTESPRFPRATLCDVDIRQLQNVQRYTVQCVLPVNMYNEKIFLVLWFWLLGVACLAVGSFVVWVRRVYFRESQSFVHKHLSVMGELRGEDDRTHARRFTQKYLRDDGVFLLRLVAVNSNNIVLSDLIRELWKMYQDNPLGKSTPEPASGKPAGSRPASSKPADDYSIPV